MADKKAVETTTEEKPQNLVVAEEAPSSKEPESTAQTGASSREAEAFIQMRKEIKDLQRQLDEREQSVPYQSTYQYQAPLSQIDKSQYYDSATGEFDHVAYDQSVQARISQAQASQTVYAREIAKEEADFAAVKIAFPTLDQASDDYDPDFEEDVASRYYFTRYVQKRNVSISEIAKELSHKKQLRAKKEEAKVEVEHQKAAAEKESAAPDSGGQTVKTAGQQNKSEEETREETLSWRTRGLNPEVMGYDNKGMPIRRKVSETQAVEALVERLRSRPWVKTPSSGT